MPCFPNLDSMKKLRQKPGGAQTGNSRNRSLWALILGVAAVLLTGTSVY